MHPPFSSFQPPFAKIELRSVQMSPVLLELSGSNAVAAIGLLAAFWPRDTPTRTISHLFDCLDTDPLPFTSSRTNEGRYFCVTVVTAVKF
jgi:hypothetical protein